MKSFAFVCMIFLYSLPAFSGNFSGEKDPLLVTYIKNSKVRPDMNYQAELRKSSAWQNYLRSNTKWSVQYNESTQLPHRAFGKPIQVNGADPREAAMNFITSYLSDWEVPVNELQFQTVSSSSKYHNVLFYQTYKGLMVLNSQVFVKMTKDFRVNTWGIDTYKIDISEIPALSVNEAVEKGKTGITTPVTQVTTPVLKVLPVPDGRTYANHLVYELTVSTINGDKTPSHYYTLVDANTGQILYRHDNVNFISSSLNTDVRVSSTIYEFNPYVTPVDLPLRNMKVTVGINNYLTDSLGYVSLPTTTPLFANFYLEGNWSKVLTDNGTVVPHFLKSINGAGDSANFDATTSIRHVSGYYHVNNIHDFMKTFFPSFTGLDFPLPTRIDVTGGFCNAYYSGSDINFFETGSGCNCMSQIADVVYHEYGHGINDKFYVSQGGNFVNGGMGEGYADVWGISLTRIPVIGKGTTIGNPNSYIRRYDNIRKVYPTNLTGEVHDDGEIIAGAWYDTYLNFGSWSMMTSLFAQTFYDLVTGPDGTEGQVYSDILLAALNEDDDDADLSNGTPHDQEILDAFALHGIYLINNATFEHNQLYAASGLAPVTITSELDGGLPWMGVDFNLFYRTGPSGPYTSVPMTLVSGNTYSADIPQQSPGTIISYFLKLEDGFSTTLKVMPAEADSAIANIPYFVLVSCVRNLIDDFDANQSVGWQTGIAGDSATGGQWVIAPPVVSFKSGDTCQVGIQHTPGGTRCAVTGNAVSVSSPNYNSDVDNGKTTLQSPMFSLTGMIDPVVTYWRWYTNDQGSAPRTDFWKTYVSGDGVNYTLVEDCGAPDHSWRRFAFKISDYIPSATNIMIRFVADDSNPASVVEVALDDIEILSTDFGNGIVEHGSENLISVFPTPASDYLNVDITAAKAGDFTFDVVDNLGQVVLTDKVFLSAGKNLESINVSSLENGVYYLVTGMGSMKMQKVFSVLR